MTHTSAERKPGFCRADPGHPFPPMRPGRGAANRIAGTLDEQLRRALTPRVFSDIDLSRRELRRALRLLAAANRRLAHAGREG